MTDRVEELSYRFRTRVMSPLRYPGGKRRLAAYIATAFKMNELRPKLFVEPFAGGASVALQLLSDGLVDSIAIGEQDPLVASFWKVVFFDADWLVDQVNDIEVTLEQWDHYRSTASQLATDRERALACLFLNRTSFSGVLANSAGPIGGRSQTSTYPIDCRFPRQTIVKRIKQAANLGDKVTFVHEGDWTQTLSATRALKHPARTVFYYFDPPFYEKADRLYRYYFTHDDHVALHNEVARLESPWLLSYDAAPSIIKMYMENGAAPTHVEILYSITASKELRPTRELVVTSLDKMPPECRLWKAGTLHVEGEET